MQMPGVSQEQTLASQTMMLPSREEVCIKPSPPHLTQLTRCVWPDSVNTHCRMLMSHTCMPDCCGTAFRMCRLFGHELQLTMKDN